MTPTGPTPPADDAPAATAPPPDAVPATAPPPDAASRPTTHRVDDIATMRALANPERLRLLGLLRRDGPRTVGALAEASDLAVGSVSYHLRKLADHAFVEQAPELARDSRERWWRATSEVSAWDPAEMLDDPGRMAAMTALQRAVFQGYAEKLSASLAGQAREDPRWLRATISSDQLAHLTVEELAEASAELDLVLARWHARSDPRRPGTRPVVMIVHAFPEA